MLLDLTLGLCILMCVCVCMFTYSNIFLKHCWFCGAGVSNRMRAVRHMSIKFDHLLPGVMVMYLKADLVVVILQY